MHTHERIIDGDKSRGEFHIVKSMDVEPMLKALQELPEHIRYKRSTQSGVRHLFSLPPLIAVTWAREWGVSLYSHEFNELARSRVMNDPNWQKLRVRVS